MSLSRSGDFSAAGRLGGGSRGAVSWIRYNAHAYIIRHIGAEGRGIGGIRFRIPDISPFHAVAVQVYAVGKVHFAVLRRGDCQHPCLWRHGSFGITVGRVYTA